ncbi:molecular chaperone [Piscinibacter sp.]|uniref:TorD/DmsD family molecular chaperone n=1 Tax=Piscinibacter sp. TaxID=1903157 RepID=UPI0035597226
MFRLLAGAFAEEPSRDYLQALRQPESLAALAEAGLNFDADFLQPELDRVEDELACEFASLLAAPGGCPPVESARLTGRYQQQPYFEVKEAYRAAGFEVHRGRFEVFDDALGVELLFVSALLDRAGHALEQGDLAARRRTEKELKRFWVQHLGRWVRGYARLVARATEHSFYREMATLLRELAEDELARLGLRVEDADGGREDVPKSEVAVLFNPDEPVCGACEFGRQRAPVF